MVLDIEMEAEEQRFKQKMNSIINFEISMIEKNKEGLFKLKMKTEFEWQLIRKRFSVDKFHSALEGNFEDMSSDERKTYEGLARSYRTKIYSMEKACDLALEDLKRRQIKYLH